MQLPQGIPLLVVLGDLRTAASRLPPLLCCEGVAATATALFLGGQCLSHFLFVLSLGPSAAEKSLGVLHLLNN